jgi:molybdate transport system ATP-binding protein
MIEFAMRHAYDDFALDIAFESDARTLALFGDSGAGKTSVLDAISGLLRPAHGRVAIDGRVLFDSDAKVDLPASRRRIGYVFQDGRLFPHRDVRANITYGIPREGATVDVDAIVRLLDLAPLLSRMPAHLSGGERQRVAIARALLSAPRALLLDEPLTGLHAAARAQVLDYLARLKRELRVLTVLVSHHAAEVAALADEVVLLDAGTVAARVDVDTFASRYSPPTSAAPA